MNQGLPGVYELLCPAVNIHRFSANQSAAFQLRSLTSIFKASLYTTTPMLTAGSKYYSEYHRKAVEAVNIYAGLGARPGSLNPLEAHLEQVQQPHEAHRWRRYLETQPP